MSIGSGSSAIEASGRWRRFFRKDRRSAIGEILARSSAKMDLQERIRWAESVIDWLKQGEGEARLRFFFQFLDQNPEIRKDFLRSIATLVEECSFLNFFLTTGYTNELGLWSEVLSRLLDRILPEASTNDIRAVFTRLFSKSDDFEWFSALSDETLARFSELFSGDEFRKLWRGVLADLREALLILATNVAHHGLSLSIRSRTRRRQSVVDAPFLALSRDVQALAHDSEWPPAAGSTPENIRFEESFVRCRADLDQVYRHFEESGVSVASVHRTETLSASLDRIEALLRFEHARDAKTRARFLAEFFEIVARASARDRSVAGHLGRHFYLLSRKIAERNGLSGEHYIARSGVEARELFVSALGGGVIVVLMTLSKTYVLHAGLAPLFLALAVWIVYAGGFLAMQACGFTLATKIPSFAATRLAQWIRDARSKNDARKFAGEVGLVVKSQIYGLAGNVIAVLAGAWILQRAFVVWPSLPGVFDNSYSVHTLEDLHPFRSPAVLLGALTGAELWASSICGGWFENFVVFRGIPEGIANHARLRRIFGAETARRYADRFLKHASGIATNISLGFFFAFVPIFGALGGLNLESKHVTIATTGATFAITRLGIDGNSSIIVPAVIGLALVAMMNFFVSFALAMVVAVRAQNVHRAWLWHFLRSIWRKPSKV